VIEKIPLFALAAVSAVATFPGAAIGRRRQGNRAVAHRLRMENALVSYAIYCLKDDLAVRAGGVLSVSARL